MCHLANLARPPYPHTLLLHPPPPTLDYHLTVQVLELLTLRAPARCETSAFLRHADEDIWRAVMDVTADDH